MITAVRIFLEIVGGLVALATVISAVASLIFGVSLGLDQTQPFRELMKDQVRPLTTYAEKNIIRPNEEFLKSENNTVNDVVSFLREETISSGKAVEVVAAARALGRMIECQNSWFCFVHGYNQHENEIRLFWYTYKAFLVEERKRQRSDFADKLEAEATRILEEDREAGLLPAKG